MRCLSLFIVLVPAFLFGQSSEDDAQQIDSMTAVINSPNSNDTMRVDALLDKAWYYYIQYPDSSIDLCERAKELSEDLNYNQGKSGAYAWLGYLYNDKGAIQQALEYFDKSLKLYEQLEEKEGMANSYNNIGAIFKSQGDLAIAFEYYQKSLLIREEVGDRKGVANTYNNMGIIYKEQGKIDSAMEYYQKSLAIDEELNNTDQIAGTLGNIGAIYDYRKDWDQAIHFYTKSLTLNESLEDLQGQAIAYNNIGGVHLKRGNFPLAQISLDKGLAFAREAGSPRWISEASNNLRMLLKMQGDFMQALEMYELHIQMRDSIKNEATQKASIRQQTKYEFEKAQLVKEQEEREVARLAAEATSRRDNLQYSVILIAILTLFGGVLALGFINVSEKMAEGIIFFSFLILFEFLLVLADPSIEAWSGGAPGIKLLFNAGIAALIFPAHAFFEAKLKGRLVKQ